jgi:hypothetical protein
MDAFLLWPLAALQLVPRTLHHLYRTLTKETTTR